LVPLLATLLIACAGEDQGATPPRTATTATATPTSSPATGTLKVGVWAEVFGTGSCLNTYYDLGARVIGCQPDGFVGLTVGGPLEQEGRRWWAIAGQGWANEEFLRYHHEGPPPWPQRSELRGAGKIAFAAPDGLWLMNADGSEKRKLADLSLEMNQPISWSPQGDKIAFATPDGLWLMNADGSEKRKLADVSLGRDHRISWSPQGDKIAVGLAFPSPGGRILVLDLDAHLLLEIPEAGRPSWSPRGDLLAYAAGGDFIRIVDLQGRVLREIANSLPPFFWSPDGRKISFAQRVGEAEPIPLIAAVVLDLETGQRWDVDPGSASAFTDLPLFSPDGRWVAYGDRLIDADTRAERPLPGLSAAWSPDGRFLILFILFHDQGNPWGIYDVGQESLVMTFDPGLYGSAAAWEWARFFHWSEDGSHLVFGWFHPSEDADRTGVGFIDLDQMKFYMVSARSPGGIALSPDGQYLVFSNSLETPDGSILGPWLWVVDMDGSNLTLLTEGSQPAWQPRP